MVVGTLIDTLPPYSDTNPLDIDNDFSMGILPSCIPLGSQGPFTAANPAPGPFGYLITEQPVTKNGVPPPPAAFTGLTGVDYQFQDPNQDKRSQVLRVRRSCVPTCFWLRGCPFPWLRRSSFARFQLRLDCRLILAPFGLTGLGIGVAWGILIQGSGDVNPNLRASPNGFTHLREPYGDGALGLRRRTSLRSW
jgi:hypothetical protein